MKRLVPAFGVPLILAVGLTQGDARLTAALPAAPGQGQPAPPPVTLPKLRVAPLPKLALPFVVPRRAPGDVIPRAYMVYGLRTGPGGMAFTDRNGAVLPVPSNARVILKPFNGFPIVPPPTSTAPRLYIYPSSPKK